MRKFQRDAALKKFFIIVIMIGAYAGVIYYLSH